MRPYPPQVLHAQLETIVELLRKIEENTRAMNVEKIVHGTVEAFWNTPIPPVSYKADSEKPSETEE